MASRKNCSEIKLSAGDSDENGPFPTLCAPDGHEGDEQQRIRM
jgi:hypothetical protein